LKTGKTAYLLNKRLRREKAVGKILQLFLLVQSLRAQVPVSCEQLTEEEIEAFFGRFKRLLEELLIRLSPPSYHVGQMPAVELTAPNPEK